MSLPPQPPEDPPPPALPPLDGTQVNPPEQPRNPNLPIILPSAALMIATVGVIGTAFFYSSNDVQSLQNQIGGVSEDLAVFQERMTQVPGQVSTIEASIDELTDADDTLKKDMASLSTDIYQFQGELRELTARVEDYPAIAIGVPGHLSTLAQVNLGNALRFMMADLGYNPNSTTYANVAELGPDARRGIEIVIYGPADLCVPSTDCNAVYLRSEAEFTVFPPESEFPPNESQGVWATTELAFQIAKWSMDPYNARIADVLASGVTSTTLETQ